MLTVYNCLVQEHDLRLVGLAAVLCALATLTSITLLHHVRRSTGHAFATWLAVAAVATGFGIWATHFIAMLAFSPDIPSGYDLPLTALSIVLAIGITGIGLGIAMVRFAGSRWIGGAVVGAGIAAMHFTGMAAFQIAGHVVWNPTLVAASLLLGGALGAVALPIGLHADTVGRQITGALLLTAAICSLHFTAMGAVSIIPDAAISVPESALPPRLMALAVGVASFAIIVLALAGLALDIRDRRRATLETDRMRELANASVEGLVICDHDVVVSLNNSFAALAGAESEKIVGARLERFLPEQSARLQLLNRTNQLIETEMRTADDGLIPVELIARAIHFGGKTHHAIAVRDLRSRKMAEKHIRFLAHHDALTGLPNRATFNTKLDRELVAAEASGQCLAVLCLDLDRFKEVNDLFGHAAGDALLQIVAKTVTAVLDDTQMMARLGGDEFAVILPGVGQPSAAGRVAERILQALRSANAEPTTTAMASTSIGIALYPSDATDRQALLSHADTALYRAKLEGRGGYRFFEAKMGAEVRERRMLEHDLRHAVAREQLRLVYQPQQDVKSGSIVGFEALLRWTHPTRGEVPPSLFIPIAEESDVILGIGEWVLRAACTEAASWKRPLTVAVNVSAVQIHNTNFSQMVHEILLQTGLPPNRLELEVTETALVRDFNRALATLRQIKALGVRVAMDDFGTGYSSLSNLRAFPFDKIKVDGSFVKAIDSNEQAATIVRAVLGLGRGLGLPVLAEGVETADELRFLTGEQCDEVQGYLLGKPAAISDFAHFTGMEPPGDEATAPEEVAQAARAVLSERQGLLTTP